MQERLLVRFVERSVFTDGIQEAAGSQGEA
jgi:hypothetical protein